MKRTHFLFLITLMGCNIKNTQSSDVNKPVEETSTNNSLDGILILYPDSAQRNKFGFEILNEDRTPFKEIFSFDTDGLASQILKDKIFAYYPDYNIVHFRASVISDSLYRVKLDTTNKLIMKAPYTEFLTWKEYILRFFSTTTSDNPLRLNPEDNAKTLGDLNYEDLNFRNTQISGDWVKVVCNKDCEGCPDNDQITGWLRWRKNGEIILNIHYAC